MRHTFFCIDGHTGGNPVRLVVGGAPLLQGGSMSARRQDFLARFDWIRTGLMNEPHGHDMMSGGFLYPPTLADTDAGILFIETSGCLPMCGHGTIGIVTFALEHGVITPREPGRLRLEVPAGVIDVTYTVESDKVACVKITNVPAFLAAEGIDIEIPGFGPLKVDVAYGGNFYAIIEPQGPYTSLDDLGAARLLHLSPIVRRLVTEKTRPGASARPDDPRGEPRTLGRCAEGPRADGRNAVFYGDRAIDRSPCGTGTSARLAQLVTKDRLRLATFLYMKATSGAHLRVKSKWKSDWKAAGRLRLLSKERPFIWPQYNMD
jgi:4-hydroxyproline epimerase